MVGVYSKNRLIKSYTTNEQTTKALPEIFKEIFENYNIDKLLYTNGPGSFMAIKASYIFLKTLQISKNLEFLSSDGFSFNQNSPIKSMGNKWFIKENNDIVLKENRGDGVQPFAIPITLDMSIFSKNVEPLYILPAV